MLNEQEIDNAVVDGYRKLKCIRTVYFRDIQRSLRSVTVQVQKKILNFQLD